jgi:glycosyltransferase involved in cell wall biosynthesis
MDKNITWPFFSIIVPSYNRAHLISKTIDSLLHQTYNNYEIIIIDDGSTDNTEDVVKKYSTSGVIYVKKQNAERSAARNFGTVIAKGQYINWFDSDDIAFDNHLDEARRMIDKYDSPELFALPYQIQHASGKIIHKIRYPLPTINTQLIHGNKLACNPVFVRRDVAVQFPFNEDRNLSGSEDYELWMRLSARFPIYCGTTITSALIEHDTRSMNNTTGNNMLLRYKLLLQYLTGDELFNSKFSENIPAIKGSLSLLVALFFSLEKNKKLSVKYLLESLRNNPLLLFSRRMLAVLKHLIVN